MAAYISIGNAVTYCVGLDSGRKVTGLLPAYCTLICSAVLNCAVQVALMVYCPEKFVANGQSVKSSVYDTIVRSWLWSSAIEICPLGYFSYIIKSNL